MGARGPFVVLDGIDGCGKSTQAARLVAALEAERGAPVRHLREPGSTALGEALRALLLDRASDLTPAAEALLFVAARRQLLEELVAPALAAGEAVVCERFHPATFAYQGVAGGVGEEAVLALCEGWAGAPVPDLVAILDLDPELAQARRGAATDRIEDRGLEFQRRVAQGFRRYAERLPATHLVDASGSADEVEERLRDLLRRHLDAPVR